jgi:hypothetical protein
VARRPHYLSCTFGWRTRTLVATQVVLHNPLGANARSKLWSQWSHDLHHFVDMAQHVMTVSGQATVMPSTSTIIADDSRIALYITSYPVRLVVILHVVSTYHVVINHCTMLSITSLQVLCTFFIPITGTTSLRPFSTGLPPEVLTWLGRPGRSPETSGTMQALLLGVVSWGFDGSSPQPNGATPNLWHYNKFVDT